MVNFPRGQSYVCLRAPESEIYLEDMITAILNPNPMQKDRIFARILVDSTDTQFWYSHLLDFDHHELRGVMSR